MTTETGKKQYTRNEVARFKAIDAKKKAAGQKTETTGDKVRKPKQFKLQDVAPFDAMIGFTDVNRGMTNSENSRPFTSLKGAEFLVDGEPYVRTCMAYGAASEAINTMLDAGETMFEVQLTPNYQTMLITGLVVDGEFKSFPRDKPVVAEAGEQLADAA